MNCTICQNVSHKAAKISNNCVIECLDKIKDHYLDLNKQINDKDSVINALKDANSVLKQTIVYYQQIQKNDCFTDIGSKLKPETFENEIAEISTDDLNMALNEEKEFEISFINKSIVTNEENQRIVERVPMKVLTFISQCAIEKNALSKKKDDSTAEMKKNEKKSMWMSKENEIKTKHPKTSLKSIKKENTNLSLKCRRLRQTRLQLHVSKILSSNAEDSTFCDEAIEASPKSNSALRKSNPSRISASDRNKKLDDDIIFEMSKPFTEDSEIAKSTSPKNNNNKYDTSSIAILTPATQDIIFLDDSCESSNIESMDLLRDLMNPSESHLINLRRIESNRIKLIQKTVNEKIDYPVNKNENINPIHEKNTAQLSSVEKCDFNMDQSVYSIGLSGHENEMFKGIHKLRETPLKYENHLSEKINNPLDVDCKECQTYIKYLGKHLTNEEIERHIRNCTKHKNHIERNLTPDGFWDPLIKPLNKNDPRNETLIDTRFVNRLNRN